MALHACCCLITPTRAAPLHEATSERATKQTCTTLGVVARRRRVRLQVLGNLSSHVSAVSSAGSPAKRRDMDVMKLCAWKGVPRRGEAHSRLLVRGVPPRLGWLIRAPTLTRHRRSLMSDWKVEQARVAARATAPRLSPARPTRRPGWRVHLRVCGGVRGPAQQCVPRRRPGWLSLSCFRCLRLTYRAQALTPAGCGEFEWSCPTRTRTSRRPSGSPTRYTRVACRKSRRVTAADPRPAPQRGRGRRRGVPGRHQPNVVADVWRVGPAREPRGSSRSRLTPFQKTLQTL